MHILCIYLCKGRLCPRKSNLVQWHMAWANSFASALGLKEGSSSSAAVHVCTGVRQGMATRGSCVGLGEVSLFVCYVTQGLIKAFVFFSEVVNTQSCLLTSPAVVQDQHFLNFSPLWHVWGFFFPLSTRVAMFMSNFFEDNDGRCP